MVDRPRAELHGEFDGALFGELVAVEAELEPGRRARLQIASRLFSIERAVLEEDVGRFCELRSLRQYL